MTDAPDITRRLVESFSENIDSYRSSVHNEAQVRIEFIDPMFKALRWDVDNEAGYAEAFKDVVHEDAIKVGGATKAPDYCFRGGGARKFFLEAKKPAVSIRTEPIPAYQLPALRLVGQAAAEGSDRLRGARSNDCRMRPPDPRSAHSLLSA